jgi:DNA polymerase-3 subunit epsilon
MDFVVIDVETANPNPRSICQIGIATYQNGNLSELWGSLINPEDSFSALNIAIHGIWPGHVLDAPNWAGIQRELRPRLEQRTLASHTYFDFRAITGANERYGLPAIPRTDWVDTCKVARAAWPSLSSHRLPHLARVFGISYQAHNAAEDARCAGEILLLAVQTTGLALKDLLRADNQSISNWFLRLPH